MSHEGQHIAARRLLVAALVLGASVILIGVVCWFLWHAVAPASRTATLPDTPRLQTDARSDLAAFRKDQRNIDRYEWVDPEHRFARVPVDRAMAIAAKDAKP